jgi:glycosyltransferase involved in cell wall biosynthesis
VKADRAIVMISTSFPTGRDGSEAAGSFVSDLAEELARQAPVRVVAPGAAAGRDAWAQGVDVFRFEAPDQPLSNLKPWRPADLRAIRNVLRAGLDATRLAVRSGPTSLILALWALPSGHWARRVAGEAGVPFSVWTLGSDIWTLGRIPLVRQYMGRVLREAHCRYSDGIKLAQDTRAIAGREVEFLPSTRRIESLRIAPPRASAPYRLLFLGRWHPNKGTDLLLEALAALPDDDWARIESVEIYGGGPLEPRVRTDVASLQAAGRPVRAHGYIDKPAAEAAILLADYLLIPSRIESIPVVFSDAMKLGCPVVSMPTGDLTALVRTEPVCGVLASAISAHAFAVAISTALRASAAGFETGIAVQAARFDLEDIALRIHRSVEPGACHVTEND